jgi:maltose alpha-D-glucosyltransferase/alpha-amylase
MTATRRPVPRVVAVLLLAAVALAPLPASAGGESPSPADDIRWLEEHSMLRQARDAAALVSGRPEQWRHPYGTPQPIEAVRHASVWLLDYPGSVITVKGRSVIATWAEPALWDTLRDMHIGLLHTGPVQRAGGVQGTEYTPTTDGWFDPVSLALDPALGTEEEYAKLVEAAAKRKGSIAGDLVPLHTGLGPDFHLALRRYKDYPGMYTVVEIPREDWGLLPEVKGPWAVALVPKPAAEQLAKKGYIPGRINSNDAAPEAKTWSGWSASGEVTGADGKVRRWVYLHSFKPTQPTLNWLDPSYAARRVVAGGVVRNIVGRKTRVLRLDAVPFLGIEPKPGSVEALHFKHPLSVVGTNDTAMLIRKLGGWGFHELNVPLADLKKFTANGPDLSYDFTTRAQCLHALLSGDAGPLRLAFRWMLEADVQPLAFVHDLQNHDELTFQLTEPEGRKDETFTVGGRKLTGRQLKDEMLAAMRSRAAGDAAPYNHLYRPEKDGLATTFPGFVAPALGVKDPYSATPEQVKLIARGHLLLAAANALQPGVFGVSSWDLVGALPVPVEAVKDRVGGGDFRWVNRGGVDLLGANPTAATSAFGLPRAKALYGSLPDQLKDPESFASRLRGLLAARRKVRLSEGELLAVPETKAPGLCVLVLKLPDHPVAVTVLNFGRGEASEEIDLGDAGKAAAGEWVDILTGKPVAPAGGGRVTVRLTALTGTTLVTSKGR